LEQSITYEAPHYAVFSKTLILIFTDMGV
jgi:hypothetical protein